MIDYNERISMPESPERRHSRQKAKDRLFVLRNVLNTVFVLGALVGVVCYVAYDRTVGTYIVIGSLPLKFIEAALRLIKI